MNHSYRHILRAAMLCGLMALSASCVKRVGPTTLYVEDPVRHYYPLVQGEDLKMNYLIVNRGKTPFILKDVQPASLSIELLKTPPQLIPSGDSATISLVYHTDMNIGFSEHKIRIYGNVCQYNDSDVVGVVDLTFDTHIVRPSLDQSDYEERYWEKKALNEKLVEGKRGEQGYYTDEDILEWSQEENYEYAPNTHRDQQVKRSLDPMGHKK